MYYIFLYKLSWPLTLISAASNSIDGDIMYSRDYSIIHIL